MAESYRELNPYQAIDFRNEVEDEDTLINMRFTRNDFIESDQAFATNGSLESQI